MFQIYHVTYSISNIPRDLNCTTKFCSSSYEYQELSSRKTIDNAKLHDELYLFKDENSRTRQALVFILESISARL